MIFRPVRPGVGLGPSDDELPSRVDEDELRLVQACLVAERGRQHRREHVLDHVRLDRGLDVDAVRVLAHDEQALDLGRTSAAVLVLLVADGHHRLPIGAEIRERPCLPDIGEPAADRVRERDR